MFGLKDVFTTINLLGGVVGICLCIAGQPFEAGVAVMLGYLFGDTLDGWVARKLNSANQFGAEYDTIADHTCHVIAPAAIVYTVYKDAQLVPAPWDQVLAMALASSIIVAASIRHARNVAAPIEFKGIWAGLPRSVLGFYAIAYCNAELAPYAAGGWWFGVGLIPGLSVATLTRWPYPSHHLPRTHFLHVRVAIYAFFLLTFGTLFLKPQFMFDVMFIFMTGYAIGSWSALTTEERGRFREAVQDSLARQAAAQG